MANHTVYPYGTGGSLPSSIGLVNDLTTGGADKALTAEMGKYLGQRQDDAFDEESDLEISDDSGNVLVQLSSGHIKTKNFDSSNITLSSLPSYWKSYLDTKLDSIKSDELSLGRDGFSFIFVTDQHWDDNAKKSPEVIKYIQENTNISDCICGGDVIVGHGTRTAKLNEMMSFHSAMSVVNPIVIVGNHDYNTSDQATSQQSYFTDPNLISPGEFYRIFNVPAENIVHYEGTTVSGKFDEYYGYKDNESQKVRFIFLDSGAVHIPNWADTNLRISDTQIDWMKGKITELQAGWTVLVFTHIFFQSYNGTVHGIGTQIETALDSIYDTTNATIAGVVCGHVHSSVSKTSSKGYPIIATTTDSAGQVNREGITYTTGTTAEQAFDIYFVDTKNKTIKVTRIGAGDTTKDRTFTF